MRKAIILFLSPIPLEIMFLWQAQVQNSYSLRSIGVGWILGYWLGLLASALVYKFEVA
jgi:hypothetical protein